MTRFATEYGGALFELACEEQISDRIMAELKQVVAIFDQDAEYLRLLNARSLEPAVRKQLLEEAFADAHPYLLNFMKLLIDRGAMDYFPERAAAYRARYNDMMGICRGAGRQRGPAHAGADRRASRAPCRDFRQKCRAAFARRAGACIGGVCVDLLGRRYDNTVRTRLQQLRRNLMEQE